MAEANGLLAQPLELVRRSLLILYGTETGHSQEIAEELADMAIRLRFETSLEEMDGVELRDLLRYELVIFVTSTTGQGDMPGNATTFWKSLLRKKLPPTCLSRLKFSIFGLGDSSYPKFNWAARKLHKRLLQLGAQEFYPPGEGDERHDNGIDSIYLPWYQDLRRRLQTGDIEPIPDEALLAPRYPIKIASPPMMTTPSDRLGGLSGQDLQDEKELIFWENREKNAALSHIENPRSADYQFDEDQDRLIGQNRGIPVTARQDENSAAIIPHIKSVDALDKDNLLRDHPKKYLLHGPSPGANPILPPEDILPIPNTYRAMLMDNTRVTPPEHWQDVRTLSIRIEAISPTERLPPVRPGSTLIIYPKNYPEDVEKLIDLNGWIDVADKPIAWVTDSSMTTQKVSGDQVSMGSKAVCPRNLHPLKFSTLRELFVHNLDFTTIPNRTFLRRLIHFASDEREKERLRELISSDNSQEFWDYTSRPRRTILEVLEDFPSVKIPLEYVLDLFPIIRGREFSIANGGVLLQKEKIEETNVMTIELIVALVEYKTIIRRPREGLCSRYLKRLPAHTPLAVGFKYGNGPPCSEAQAKKPLIAIATGTGIAPVRSLLWERKSAKEIGDQLLFFGCRNREADFYYKDDWEVLGYKLQVIPAFSRDPDALEPDVCDPYKKDSAASPYDKDKTGLQPPDAESTGLVTYDYDRGKMYVQHLIRKHAQEVCDLMDRDAIIMLCGNSGRMPVSVRRALLDAMVIGGKAEDIKEAEAKFSKMAFWQETW